MRTSSINILLLAIAICDFYNMSRIVVDSVIWRIEDDICYWPSSYYVEIFHMVKRALYDCFRRLIVWFAVLMAFIRFVVIKNAMSPTFQKLSETLFGLIVILIVVLISCGVTSIMYSQQIILNKTYRIPEECVSKFPPNFKARIYLPSFEYDFVEGWDFFGLRTFGVIDGSLKIIATIALPILTILLCIELEIARRNRRKLSGKDVNTKPDYTTKMITLMTAASIIAECPLGILYVVNAETAEGFRMLASDMASIWEFFLAINSSTHCLISLVISTQYRKAVQDTFSFVFKAKKESTVISVSSKSKSGSVVATNQANNRRKSEY
ncbi:unnamed protein product [Caenorhabditis nigoni]